MGEVGKGYSYSTLNFSTPTFGAKVDSFEVSLATSPRAGKNILVGPPFIPVVPALPSILGKHKKEDENFFVDFKFINKTLTQIDVDLSKISFQQKQISLKPSDVAFINSKNFGWVKNINLQEKSIPNFSISSIISIKPHDSLIVRFTFEQMTRDIKLLTVQFGDVQKEFPIPSIRLITKKKFIYRPIYDQ